MMFIAAINESPSLLAQLANPAVRALALAGAAGLGLWAFRVKATSARLYTWTAVLYAALAMPLLGRMVPPLPAPMPAFLQDGAAQLVLNQFRGSQASVTEPVASMPRKVSVAARRASSIHASPQVPPSFQPSQAQPVTRSRISHSSETRWSSMPWSVVATGIYLAGALFLLVRLAIGIVFGGRLMRSSRRIHESRVALRLASCAHACGLAFVPPAAESEFIAVPVTAGALRSTVLLPAGWRDWDDAKLDAVVAHEVSHVARRDALTQRLSLLHRAVFWFSPLAWWLDRRLADLAEQASDEAALSCGADRNDYARTLLGFFEALHAAPGRVWWQGVAMAKAGQAEKRLERILAWRGAATMSLQKSGLKKSIAVAIIAFAIPVVYLAASVRPAGHNQGPPFLRPAQTQTPPAPNVAPAPPAAPAEPATLAPPAQPAPVATVPMLPPPAAAPARGMVSTNGALWVRPVVPIAPVAAVPPIPPIAPRAPRSLNNPFQSHSYGYRYGHDDDQRFVIVYGKSDSLTMSGSTEDARHVEKLRKQIPGDFIWFQRDEKSYIIRDQATIDRARKLWAPQEELGKKQEELGKQQEALGKQQEELGAKMEQVYVNVPDIFADLDKLKAELKQLKSSATVDQLGHLQSEIGELQSKIGESQSQAGEQQSKLGELMSALGEQQGKLGEQQGELGRQQGELAEQASRQMKELLDEAIKKGTAQPEP